MYNKNLPECRGFINEFHIGFKQFLDFASSKVEFMDGNKIRSLCKKCSNCKFHVCDKVREHFCIFGFTSNYYNLTYHGEPFIFDKEYRRSK